MSQVSEERRNNILLEYDIFLINQAKLVHTLMDTIKEQLKKYKNSYKAYFLDNLSPEKKIAYEKNLEEIQTINSELKIIAEILNDYGIIAQEITGDNLEKLRMYKINNEQLKVLVNKMKSNQSSSEPQKENYSKQYEMSFLYLIGYVFLFIAIGVITYIQISNKN